MTEPNERSDPVKGYLDVTPEQLDQLHRTCGHHSCDGYSAEYARRSTEQWKKSLLGINAALAEVGEVTRTFAARVQENARILGTHDEPLAEWERELLAAVAAEEAAEARSIPVARPVPPPPAPDPSWQQPVAEWVSSTTGRAMHIENLQAGLQHQRVGISHIEIW
jgi:uncharacterized protein YukE